MAPFTIPLDVTAREQSLNELALSFLRPTTHKVFPRSLISTSTLLTSRSSESFTRSVSSVFRRQTSIAIPTTYSGLNAGPTAGTVVGIVLGSVAGFLLILWLIYTCFNMGGDGGAVVAEEVIRRRSRSPRSARRSVSRSEVIEVSRQRSPEPPRRESSRRETLIVEETRRPAPRQDDIVEVIEEHSPSPRRERRGSIRQSGYRTVDPLAYGGGERPTRKVGSRR